jgi:hypothetical protein
MLTSVKIMRFGAVLLRLQFIKELAELVEIDAPAGTQTNVKLSSGHNSSPPRFHATRRQSTDFSLRLSAGPQGLR